MKIIDEIVSNPIYKEHYKMIQTAEEDRIFCGHDLQHFLDVSRIAYIYVLEMGLDVSKEEVYAYGFLHDIGRGLQYTQGVDHDVASQEIAEALLMDSDFTSDQQSRIIGAIKHHRGGQGDGGSTFNALMYKADKASRACYNCKAASECYWDMNKKNMSIEV